MMKQYRKVFVMLDLLGDLKKLTINYKSIHHHSKNKQDLGLKVLDLDVFLDLLEHQLRDLNDRNIVSNMISGKDSTPY